MPIGSMGSGVRSVVSFFPGTYGTVLFRQAYMNGVLDEISKTVPAEAVSQIRKSFEGTFFFFGHEVPPWAMYLVMLGTIAVLLGVLVLCIHLKNRKLRNKRNKT